MNRHICFLFILTAICVNSYSQFDSLKNEILRYDDTTTSTIKKGRKLILESFLKNDKPKVQQLLTYLTTRVENEDYLTLYPIEKGMLNYWLGQYNDIDSDVQKYTDDYFNNNNKKLRPEPDLLFEKVKTFLKEHKSEQITQN